MLAVYQDVVRFRAQVEQIDLARYKFVAGKICTEGKFIFLRSK